MPTPRPDDGRDRSMRSAGMYLAIPSLLVAGPLVGFFLGKLVERWIHCEPWGVFVGLVMGFVAAGREIYLIILRAQKEQEESDKRSRE